jgi:hypothetical protein
MVKRPIAAESTDDGRGVLERHRAVDANSRDF